MKVFRRAVHVAVLFFPLAIMSSSAFAQNATNPQSIAFTPSADHYATSSSGEPAVTQYNLEIYEVGGATPLQISSIGKPAPGSDGRIKVALSLAATPVPNTVYMARVAAMGPNGSSSSDWSNAFTFNDAGSSGTPVGSFTNGGFEADYLGWVASGSQEVVTAPWFGATVTEGSKAVVFNAGQQPASGVLSQTFTTTAGQSYTLAFDLGAVSYANVDAQSIQVTVKGVNTLVSKTASVAAPGNGIQYASQTMAFVADSASTTLSFRDMSAATMDVDMFLDNVRVTSAVSTPSISTHPQSTSVKAGDQASFSVTASGSGPLSYQWRLNGNAISGATSSTYAMTNVQQAQAGGYSVVVSNAGGSVTSNTATLTVTNQAPTITAQPQSVAVTAGSAATFGVTATGSGTLSYQWKFNNQAIGGAISTSYTVANAQSANAGAYSVTVSNSGGSVTSNAATLTVQAPAQPAGVPSPWATADIGSTGKAGSASFANGTFTVSGAGADVWGSSDGFQYVYQAVNGDAEIVARVTSVQNTNTYAKAGVMLRESLSASAAHVILDVRPDGSIEFMTRSSAGEATTYLGGAAQPVPAWLKLSRAGNTVTGYVSNGSTWVMVGSATTTIASSANLGLLVNSHDTGALNMSTFDNVTVTAAAAVPSPWATADIGSTGKAGNASFANGTFTVSGAGADIWGSSDAFRYVYQAVNGDAEIVARVTSVQNTNLYAKAGVMLRESLSAGAAHVILDVRPDGSIEFMTRSSAGASTTYLDGAAQPVPTWLKLSRTGSTVTGYVSSNGSAWAMVGSTTTAIAASANVGLLVNSHDTSALNTATFDNVKVTVASATPAGLVNGGFEADYTNWTASGNQGVYTSGVNGFTVKEGSKAVVFNSGQKTPNGVLAQTFTVVPGTTYTLTFDVGAYSLATADTQMLQVTVQGKNLLLSKTASVVAQANGARWTSQSYTFVADSNTATLTFQDVSATSDSIDMLLDNVKATAR